MLLYVYTSMPLYIYGPRPLRLEDCAHLFRIDLGQAQQRHGLGLNVADMLLPQVHVVPRSQLPACRAQRAYQLKTHFFVQVIAFLVRAHDLAHNRAHTLQREQVK